MKFLEFLSPLWCVLLLLVHCPSSLVVVLFLHCGFSSLISSGFSFVTVFLTLCFRLLSESFLILKRIERGMIKNVCGSSRKGHVILVRF